MSQGLSSLRTAPDRLDLTSNPEPETVPTVTLTGRRWLPMAGFAVR
jgi:hypothetical protein